MKRSTQRHVVGVSPLAKTRTKEQPPISGGTKIQNSVEVQKPAEICYQYWRDFKNLASFLKHVDHVDVLDSRRSHWVIKGPADTTLEWDAEIIEDIPNQRISWRTLDNAQIDNAGSVQFRPLQEKTQINVTMSYNPPLGVVGELFSRIFGENPKQQLEEDLAQFKAVLERRG
jgi:uncharacterized membrane protein